MKRAFADTAAGQIHYRTEGDGEPLLLLHQVACSSAEFVESIPVLGKRFCVLAMDMPLYGDSYRPEGEPSIAGWAKAAFDFLDAVGVKKCHIAGHHTGASVAVEMAVEHPERVGKLVLSGCLSFNFEDSRKWLDNPRYKSLKVTEDGWFMKWIWDYVMERIPHDRLDKALDYIQDYMKSMPRTQEGYVAVFKYDMLPKLDRITQPTLVMCGDKDVVFPYYEVTLRHAPHAKGKVIKGANAQLPRVFPEKWAEALLDFLRAELS